MSWFARGNSGGESKTVTEGGLSNTTKIMDFGSLFVVIPVAQPNEEGLTLLRFIEPTDMAWIVDQNGSTETYNFYLHMENGDFVFLVFAVSSIGFVSRSTSLFE